MKEEDKDKVTAPIMAEFVLSTIAFQKAFNLTDGQMLIIITEQAEVIKRVIYQKRMRSQDAESTEGEP